MNVVPRVSGKYVRKYVCRNPYVSRHHACHQHHHTSRGCCCLTSENPCSIELVPLTPKRLNIATGILIYLQVKIVKMPPAKEQDSMASPHRRKIKAKAPPPALDLPVPAPPEEQEVEIAHATFTLGSPSVEREMEQETADKWRAERLEGMAAKQKLERDKEILERRQSSSTPTRDVVGAQSSTIPPEKLKDFSVEPQFPEHKRTGDTISGISEGEPNGKRRKASVDEGYEEEKVSGGVSKMMVVSALVAAVAIGVAIFRRSARS